MTPEEKAKAKEQAKRFLAAPLPIIPAQEQPKPKSRKIGWTKSRALPIGVYLARARSIKPYRVQLRKNGKAFTIGTFETVDEASVAVKNWKEKNP